MSSVKNMPKNALSSIDFTLLSIYIHLNMPEFALRHNLF